MEFLVCQFVYMCLSILGIQIRHGPARNPEWAGLREPWHHQEPEQEPGSRSQPAVKEYWTPYEPGQFSIKNRGILQVLQDDFFIIWL